MFLGHARPDAYTNRRARSFLFASLRMEKSRAHLGSASWCGRALRYTFLFTTHGSQRSQAKVVLMGVCSQEKGKHATRGDMQIDEEDANEPRRWSTGRAHVNRSQVGLHRKDTIYFSKDQLCVALMMAARCYDATSQVVSRAWRNSGRLGSRRRWRVEW